MTRPPSLTSPTLCGIKGRHFHEFNGTHADVSHLQGDLSDRATSREVSVPRDLCGDCDGVGWVEGGTAIQTTCDRCDGSGWEPER